MELRQYAGILVKWLWLIVIGTFLAAGTAYIVGRNTTPVYQASSTLMVMANSSSSSSFDTLMAGQQWAKTYGELLKKRPILEQVIKDMRLRMTPEELAGSVSTQTIRDTQFVVLRVENEDPALAAGIANQIADVSIQQNQNAQLGRLAKTVVVIEPAEVPDLPVRPKVMTNTILAAVIGAMLAAFMAFLIEYLDDRIHSPEQVDAALHLPTLGTITRMHAANPEDCLTIQKDPRSTLSEAYRVLRTNIQFSNVDEPPRTILMTSASPSEGKSTTAANLAAAMAQAGLSVALIDTDLRRPVLHRIFETGNDHGLTNTLLSPNGLNGAMRPTKVEHLGLLPTGPIAPNPSELLGSVRMKRLIADLKRAYDVVIFDSPPVLAAADAAVLASQMDAVILVVVAGQTRRDVAQRAVANLTRVGAHIIGVVLNKLTPNQGHHAYTEYYDYYRRDDRKGWRHSLKPHNLVKQPPSRNY